MKRLLIVLIAILSLVIPTSVSAITKERSEFWSLMAKDGNTPEMKMVWNGSDIVCSTAHDASFDGVEFSVDELKGFKNAFIQGMLSQFDPETKALIKSMMKEDNVHFIVKLMGSSSPVVTLQIGWNDF